jgi:hypothetical protein
MPAAERMCAQCGSEIESKDPRKMFCDKACKVAFHNLSLVRAGALLPLLQVWRAGRLKGGNKALSSYAFREACALIDGYNAQDRASGRNPEPSVQGKMDECWRAGDLLNPPVGVSKEQREAWPPVDARVKA